MKENLNLKKKNQERDNLKEKEAGKEEIGKEKSRIGRI